MSVALKRKHRGTNKNFVPSLFCACWILIEARLWKLIDPGPREADLIVTL